MTCKYCKKEFETIDPNLLFPDEFCCEGCEEGYYDNCIEEW